MLINYFLILIKIILTLYYFSRLVLWVYDSKRHVRGITMGDKYMVQDAFFVYLVIMLVIHQLFCNFAF
jgi:hypothetical protein